MKYTSFTFYSVKVVELYEEEMWFIFHSLEHVNVINPHEKLYFLPFIGVEYINYHPSRE